MFRIVCVAALLLAASLAAQARHSRHTAEATPVLLRVGGLQFSIPAAWQAQPPGAAARMGRWIVLAPHTDAPATIPAAPALKIVAIFFGPGIGGTAAENIGLWEEAVTAADGKPATATPQKRTVAGHAITEVQLTGAYAEPNPQPGVPPTPRPGYALLGAVVDNPGGAIFWRVTGPAEEVAAFAPVFDKMLDSLQSQAGP